MYKSCKYDPWRSIKALSNYHILYLNSTWKKILFLKYFHVLRLGTAIDNNTASPLYWTFSKDISILWIISRPLLYKCICPWALVHGRFFIVLPFKWSVDYILTLCGCSHPFWMNTVRLLALFTKIYQIKDDTTWESRQLYCVINYRSSMTWQIDTSLLKTQQV